MTHITQTFFTPEGVTEGSRWCGLSASEGATTGQTREIIRTLKGCRGRYE